MTGTVLILGQSGRFGRNAAQAFKAAGWDVRGFRRGKDNLGKAVKGVDVVVNAWNPPDYSTWDRDLMTIHGQVIDALKGSGTTVLVPGNVYVFGPQTPGPWGVETPHQARNRLGRLRIRMEQSYCRSGIRTILLRGGDFLDTSASGNWFDKIMVTGLAKGRFIYPGNSNIAHSWAFLPDMARAAVELCEMRHDLPVFADVPFAGFTLSGQQMAGVLGKLRGHPVELRQMAWWPLQVLRPVWPALRGLCEMRYLWDTPHSLDPDRFETLLPDFRHTSLEEALAAASAHVTTPAQAEQGQQVPVDA